MDIMERMTEVNYYDSLVRPQAIVEIIISSLKSKKGPFCRIKHKRGWLGYLKDGDTVFTPQDLKDTIIQVINDNSPKGEKLFDLNGCREENHFRFTILKKMKPYRIEEALERFIIVSNEDNFYNQIPIGGRRESIDIGIRESRSKFIFVELKPWRSDNSPMYALIECLKNLIEYRTIIEKKIKDIERFEEIELMVLAPVVYYQTYRLIKEDGKIWEDNLSVLKETLIKMGKEFQVVISFMILDIDLDSFLEKCRKIYKGQGKVLVTVSKSNAIHALARDMWKMLVSSAE